MQYQVLARKWRPQNFHELVGQEHVSRTLLNALKSGRVAHAFLLAGPRGSGKTTTARILAKALNCHAGLAGEPCGKCAACVEIAAGNCLDVLEIDAASNTGVDNVRELVEQVRYHTARDRNKIFIIDEVHMLSNAAFNALLKTLEEPPPNVVFILATTEYHKMPATILSRCQQYNFKLIQYPLILKRLRQIAGAENFQISDAALEQLVFFSGGSMRDAMSALDQVIAFSGPSVQDEDVVKLLGLVEPTVLSEIVRAIADVDTAKIIEIVGDLTEAGQDLHTFARRLLGHFRNLMVLKTGISDPAVLGVPESLLSDLREQADSFSKEELLRLFDVFLKVEAGLKYATQIRFQLEMGLIELAHLSRLRPLEDVIAEFGRMTKAETDSAKSQARAPAAAPVSHKPAAAESPGSNPASVSDGTDLLSQIAAAIGKESLSSLLQNLDGARLEGDRVILESGKSNEFLRRQINENLPAITLAASKIAGRQIRVVVGGPPSHRTAQQSSDPEASEDGLLERAKREPIIRSFLDVFPGPVKAERLDE